MRINESLWTRFPREWMGCLLVLLCLPGLNAGAAEPVTLTFLHFNDLHAHLTPHTDLVAGEAQDEASYSRLKVVERGGIARLATLIKRQRAKAAHSVLMNIGDTYHGGVEALYTLGNAVVAPVNALGIDIGVPGNWDFAYGPMVFRRRYTDLPVARFMKYIPFRTVERPAFPNLAANVYIRWPFLKRGQTILPATHRLAMGGVQVGFIGITSDIVPRMHKMLALGMRFAEGEDAYRELINSHARELRAQGVDVVVVLSELGLQKDHRLAQVVAAGSVDVFFSAHTHETTFTPLASKSGALVVEAGNDGYLGRMDLTVSGGRVTAHRWQLFPVTPDLPEDPEVARLVSEARKPFLGREVKVESPTPFMGEPLTRSIDTVVGYSEIALDRRNALESSFNRFFSDALSRYAKSDTAISPGFRFDAVIRPEERELHGVVIKAGPVTLEDVYRFFPVEYSLATGTTDVATLRGIIETNLTKVFSHRAFAQDGGWIDGYGGLYFDVDLSRPDGCRVSNLRREANGPNLRDTDRLTVAGCARPFDADGVICSYPGFQDISRLKNPETGNAWSGPTFLVHLLQQGPIKMPLSKHIQKVRGQADWPDAPFVQPLAADGLNPEFVPGSKCPQSK